MEFHGKTIRQCQQAVAGCCDSTLRLKSDPVCDRPADPKFAVGHFLFLKRNGQPLNWSEACTEINAGRPFAFAWARIYPNDTAEDIALRVSHLMVVNGYNTGGGIQTLTVLNPRPFAGTDAMMVPFSDYDGSGAYAHKEQFHLIRPDPAYP